MMSIRQLARRSVLIVGLIGAPAAGAAELPVDLELVLAVDISGSVDPAEARLQREGYIAALRHPRVIDAIRDGAFGRIALTYIEWAGEQHPANAAGLDPDRGCRPAPSPLPTRWQRRRLRARAGPRSAPRSTTRRRGSTATASRASAG